MLKLSHADFVHWRQSRAQADHHSPHGYLNLLQEIYSDLVDEGPAGIAANQAFSRLRREQMPEDPQAADEIEAFHHEPSYLSHTYMLQRIIYDPIVNLLPPEAKLKLEDTPIGVLPIRSVNAAVMLSPSNKPIIIADSGLLHMVSYFTESNLIAYTVIKDKERSEDYINARYRFILKHYANKGAVRFPDPDPKHRLSEHVIAIMTAQNICSETFVICHEIAHIISGHLTETKQLSMAASVSESVREQAVPHVYTHSQVQEFEADYVGYQLYLQVIQDHPILSAFNMTELFLTECFHIFHLMHLVESNIPTYQSVTTHPSAMDRIDKLLSLVHLTLERSGLSKSELKKHPLLRDIYKHSVILRNMPKLH